MSTNPNKSVNEPHEDGKHEGGRGGNVQGQGDRQTQKQAQDGQMPFNGLDYETQREKASERGESGNKKSENQPNRNSDRQ